MKKYLFPIFIMAILTLGFFYKIFLGLLPIPADLVVGGYYPWLDYKWETTTGVPVKNPIQSDVVSVIYPIKAHAIELIKKGELPLWNWKMFNGYPLFANLQLGLLFPSMIFYLFLSTPFAWTIQVMLQPFLAMLFMYFFLKHIGIKEQLPLYFGSIAYGFGGFAMVWLEWNVLLTTSSFLPLLILLCDKYINHYNQKWGILISITLALQILAGYPQIVVFSLLAVYCWILIQKTHLSRIISLTFFILLGISLSSIFLIPGLEQFQFSQRKIEVISDVFAFLPWQYLIAFLAPDYFGNHTTGNFWGTGEYTLLTIYSGIITLALASIQLIRPDKKSLYFIGLMILSIIIMVPNPLSHLLYNLNLWGGSGSSTTRAAFLINFSLASLSSIALSKFSKADKKIFYGPLLIFAIVVALVIGTFISKEILGKMSLSSYQTIEALTNIETTIKNLNIGLRNLFIPLLLSLSVFLVSLFTQYKNRYYKLTQILLVLLLIFELFRFGLKFNSFSPLKYLYPDTPVTSFLKDHPTDRFNGGDTIPANMWLPYDLEAASGYDAVYPLSWAKFIAVLNSGDIDAKPSGRFGTINSYDSKLFDLTSTRFILATKRDESGNIKHNGYLSQKFRLPKFKEVFEDKSVIVMENQNLYPKAFIVPQVQISTQNEVLKYMVSPAFQPLEKAFIAKNNRPFQYPDLLNQSAQVQYKIPVYNKVTNNHIQIITDSEFPGFLVTTDSYYPGWEASINHNTTHIYNTNYAFTGIELPPGENIVDFVYKPKSFLLGFLVSSISFLIILLLIIKTMICKPTKQYV